MERKVVQEVWIHCSV